MMKRHLPIIAGIAISGLLGLSVQAASSVDDVILDTLLGDVDKTYNNDAKELEALASSEDLAFQDLYLFLYQNVKEAPVKDSLKEIARRTDYSVNELESILLDGSIEPILSRRVQRQINAASDEWVEQQEEAQGASDEAFESFLSSYSFAPIFEEALREDYEAYWKPELYTADDVDDTLTQIWVSEEYTRLSELFSTELSFQKDYRTLAYEALASEIFINNDLSDSAQIDLLYDLDLVHKLLFDSFIEYPDRGGDSDLVLASESEFTLLPKVTIIPDVQLSAEDEAIDPFVCLDDTALKEELERFQEELLAGGDDGTIDVPEDYGSTGSGSGRGGEIGSAIPEDASAELTETIEAVDSISAALGAPKGDWSRSLPCNEIFCITVNLVTESNDPTVEYEETDNCIACHIAAIQERMGDTLSRSLVPGKVSMNVFEDATCKEGGNFINLDMNVYTIPVPITLDPGDDIEDIPTDNLEDLQNQLWSLKGFPLPFGSRTLSDDVIEEAKEQAIQDPSETACQSIVAMANISGYDTGLDEALEACEAAEISIRSELQETLDAFAMNTRFEGQNTLFGQVAAELSSVLDTFLLFQSNLEDTYLEEQAPLQSLIHNTDYCE